MSTNSTNQTDSFPKVTYSDGVSSTPNSSSEHQLLMQAVSTCAYQLVQQMLEKNSSIVHEKGWHGQRVLHKSALIGDYETCKMLLHYGADPNAKNDYDETPMHYACKRGMPTIIHMMYQNGGDLDAVDANGNSMCHHSAQTGSVYALAYLHLQRSQYQSVNKNLQLPLHIACVFGHVDAFKYLLKKEKNDIQQLDIDGNNVLHVAAKEGHPGLCWDILKIGGCELLHVKNKAGCTPDEIALRRDGYGHKAIAPLLQSLRKHKPQDYKVTDPMMTWYWILAKPFVLFLVLLELVHLVSQFYRTGYQGYAMTFGLICIVWDMTKNLHRINHISRMQNPAFAGAFAAGLLHTTLHYCINILPYTKQSLSLTFVSFVMMTVTYVVYYRLLTRDPGRVSESAINPLTKQPTSIIDLCLVKEKMVEFCTVCEIVKPLRTKHCRLCEHCYAEMDHHCLFLLKCVALKNHCLFVWFIIVCVVSMVIYEINLFYYLTIVADDQTWKAILLEIFYDDAWTMSLSVANFFSILWGINLVRYQLNIISKGQLTAIVIYTKKQSGLTADEKFWNVINFLQFKPPYAKDPYLAAQNLL